MLDIELKDQLIQTRTALQKILEILERLYENDLIITELLKRKT